MAAQPEETDAPAEPVDSDSTSIHFDSPTITVNRSNIDVGLQELIVLTFGQRSLQFDASTMVPSDSSNRIVGSFAFGSASFAQSHLPLWVRIVMRWAAQSGSTELLEHVEKLLLEAITEGKAEGKAEGAEQVNDGTGDGS